MTTEKRMPPVQEPFDIVVFGATGDLALRKLLPALYHRWIDGQIPGGSRILVTARRATSTQDYVATMRAKFVEFYPDEVIDEAKWAQFSAIISCHNVDIKGGAQAMAALGEALAGRDDVLRVFYLALPPDLFSPVCQALGDSGVKTENSRVVLEKPIGKNLASARAINDSVGGVFDEDKIFRIDHYLGKETVQNLLILRFANMMFEPIWNSNGIDHVQITVAEDIGAGNRASYYDTAGAMRDMVQNHLLQLLCLVAMEPPAGTDGGAVRDEKLKVLRALRPISLDTVDQLTVRGQYGSGQGAPSYTDELGQRSDIETFVAIRADIDNWRWAGVPFYLRTGKRMASRRSQIIVQFKDAPHNMFGEPLTPNRLVIRLQPDEGMKLMLMTKVPGPGGLRLRSVPLNLSYAEEFKLRYPDAYERLLLAVVRGNLELFMHRDEVEAAWEWTDAILNGWRTKQTRPEKYEAGTDGPSAATWLLDRDERKWYVDEAEADTAGTGINADDE